MIQVAEHFDKIAEDYDFWKKKNWYYYSNLKKLIGSIIPEKSNVLDIGCGTGDILINLKPSWGLGFDISKEMIDVARSKEKDGNIEFVYGELKQLKDIINGRKISYAIMVDVVEHLENPSASLDIISELLENESILIITMANPLWEPILLVLEKLKLKMPEGPHKRISIGKVENILINNRFKIVKKGYRLIIPGYIPIVSNFINSIFYKIPLIKNLALTVFWVCER